MEVEERETGVKVKGGVEEGMAKGVWDWGVVGKDWVAAGERGEAELGVGAGWVVEGMEDWGLEEEMEKDLGLGLGLEMLRRSSHNF